MDIPACTTTWIEPEVLGALRLTGEDRVLSLAAGGDLALASVGAGAVAHVAETDGDQALVELKRSGAREMPVEGLRCLLGVDAAGRRVFLYHLMREALPQPSRGWWDGHESLIRTGVLRSGRVEARMEAHRAALRTAVRLGLPPLGARLRRRMLARPDASLGRWILDGSWPALELGPTYLTPSGHAALRQHGARVELVRASPAGWLAGQPAGRFTVMILGPDAGAATLRAALTHGQPGARLLRPLWRRRDATEAPGWMHDEAAEAEIEPLALMYARYELLVRR